MLEEQKIIEKIKSPMEKLKALESLDKRLPERIKVSDYTNYSYIFIRSMRKLLQCLQNHYDGDRDAFVEQWEGSGRLSVAKFSQKCCKGEGPICGLG